MSSFTLSKAKQFLERYRLTIVDASRRQLSYRTPTYLKYDSYEPFNYEKMQYETETVVTLQVAESDLERLINLHERVEESVRHTGSMDIFSHFLLRKKEEEDFREKHPALKKAYEQYQMLLKLTASGNTSD